MKRIAAGLLLGIIVFYFFGGRAFCEAPEAPAFCAIALGTAGGSEEGNLSSYLLAPNGSRAYVALDAGSLYSGLVRAGQMGSLGKDTRSDPAAFLRDHIKAYLISHAHLDHVAGLVINSPEDRGKPVMGLDQAITTIRDHLFNWQVWPNFCDSGDRPLSKYRCLTLAPGRAYPVEGTKMMVVPMPLCHAGVDSTAFFIEAGKKVALYLGDTGPDAAEGCDRLARVWNHAAPLIREGRLAGLFAEISYPDPREKERLYGHFTPSRLKHELVRLAEQTAPGSPLTGLTLIITHIKPGTTGYAINQGKIMDQMKTLNDLGIRLVFPRQGETFYF